MDSKSATYTQLLYDRFAKNNKKHYFLNLTNGIILTNDTNIANLLYSNEIDKINQTLHNTLPNSKLNAEQIIYPTLSTYNTLGTMESDGFKVFPVWSNACYLESNDSRFIVFSANPLSLIESVKIASNYIHNNLVEKPEDKLYPNRIALSLNNKMINLTKGYPNETKKEYLSRIKNLYESIYNNQIKNKTQSENVDDLER